MFFAVFLWGIIEIISSNFLTLGNDFTHESFTIFTTMLIVFRIIWLSIIVKTIHNENKRLEDIIQNCISK